MLEWCQGISIAMSVVSGVCLFFPAPKIQATCQKNPYEFTYRVTVLPLLTWYDLFASIAIVVESFIDDAAADDSENSVYTMAAVLAAIIVATLVLLIVLYNTFACKWCCCCCGNRCTPTSLVKAAASRLARDQPVDTIQKRILSALISAIIGAFITPTYASDLSTASGVMTAVAIYSAFVIVGTLLGDCIADVLIYVQFSVVISFAVVLALFYSIAGDWTRRETMTYVKGLLIAAALSLLHITYDIVYRRRCAGGSGRRTLRNGRTLITQHDADQAAAPEVKVAGT